LRKHSEESLNSFKVPKTRKLKKTMLVKMRIKRRESSETVQKDSGNFVSEIW
jgi:hypothetical protein